MSFLNKLLNSGHTVTRLMDLADKAPQWRSQLVSKKNEFTSGAFRDAVMGMCALVAAADGTVTAEERAQVAGLITGDAVLDNFPAEQLRTLFDGNCDRLVQDPAFGRAHVLQQITKVAGKPEQARAVVQIGIMIANADGTLSPAEVHAVRDACAALGIPPLLELPR
ncbi:tellurite resistance TerB family protein [Nocardia sp. NPDC057227]|uniref:tellurite resistance TerB family protein n=1 Tax=Nocardia sp. NPDC057227 TaxID=3346056 RepID=UPI00362B5B88